MTVLRDKLIEVIKSVVPVSAFVILLQFLSYAVGFTLLSTVQLGRFLLASLLVIIGLAIFLLGIDLSITPIGASLGKVTTKRRNLLIVLIAGFFLGFLINIAEPDLRILAANIDKVSGGALPSTRLLLVVSVGVGLLVMIGFVRLVRKLSLRIIFTVTYLIIFVFALLCPGQYLAIAIDSSGATTGAVTTPFLLAVSLGLSAFMSSHERDGSEGFGMVGFASAGAILAVLVLGTFSRGGELTSELAQVSESRFFTPFVQEILPMLLDSLMAIGPIFLLFVIVNAVSRDIKSRQFRHVVVGVIYCIVGLTIFMVGVNGGFMVSGRIVGEQIASLGLEWLIVIIGFFLGMTTVLAEPAVHVLTNQIEDQTSGTISKHLVLIFLSAGVATAVALAMLRILLPPLQLWHILLPAYLAAIIMSHLVGELYTGIAFDSGGVVSGPMTATFVLAFSQGVSSATPQSNLADDAFGVIALVATSPLITLQILGLLYRYKMKKLERSSIAEAAANGQKESK